VVGLALAFGGFDKKEIGVGNLVMGVCDVDLLY
jgi:hypothetical protein